MRYNTILWFSFFTLLLASCGVRKEVYEARLREEARKKEANSSVASEPKTPKYIYGENIPDKPKTLQPTYFAQPLAISRKQFIQKAQSYIGVPYLYGGTDPSKGLDCSGFVFCVFNHFGVVPPRMSKEYTHAGKEINIKDAQPGDIILFTAPSTHKKGVVGHMGIITTTKPIIQFVHSSSGKKRGVILSELKGYYLDHFVKVIRVLK